MALKIEKNDELIKRRQELGIPTVQVNPEGEQGQGGKVSGAQSFEDRYNANNVFGAAKNVASGSVTPTYQNAGAAAGSSVGSNLSPNDGGPSNFSLSDAVQMDNLPPAVTATPTQNPELASGLTAGGNAEKNNSQGGATSDNGNNSAGYKASHNAILKSLQWVSTTEKTPNTSGEGTISLDSTGGADKSAGVNGTTNEIKADSAKSSEKNNGTDETNNAEGNVNGSGNKNNVNDSANGNENTKDSSNPKVDNTEKADVKLKEKQAEEAARKKVEEETAARRQAEQNSA